MYSFEDGNNENYTWPINFSQKRGHCPNTHVGLIHVGFTCFLFYAIFHWRYKQDNFTPTWPTVEDVPGVPKNGRVLDIGNDCATVQWDAPSDDGGSAITGYVIEKKETARRTFHRVTQVCYSIKGSTVLLCITFFHL